MASPNSGKILSLKALVEKGSNKVIFVESDNAFVDVLLSFLTIPLGTIIRLGRKHSTVPVETGCFNNLYSSVENFGEHEFLSQTCREMLLHPRSVAEADCNNLKLQIADQNVKPIQYFVCSNSKYCLRTATGKLFSYHPGSACPFCSSAMHRELNVSVNDGSRAASGAAFVKCQARLLVTDDLQVISPFPVSTVSLFSKLGITNRTTAEELTLNIGDEEVLCLLMNSLASKTPLTETLLKHKPVTNPSNENGNSRAIYIDPPEVLLVHDTSLVEEENISVKLIISKSKKMVCYAQAGEDFVNLLFNFLTLPLGFIAKQIRDGSLKGCIDKLYSSVQDLDEQYLKSNHHKETLLNPKLLPGHCYNCNLLGIEEAYLSGSELTGFKLTYERLREFEAINLSSSARGFLKGPAIFTVTDNLVVRPISTIFELSVLDELEVPFSDIEDKVVVMGKNEASSLLVASFVCDSALTRAFIS